MCQPQELVSRIYGKVASIFGQVGGSGTSWRPKNVQGKHRMETLDFIDGQPATTTTTTTTITEELSTLLSNGDGNDEKDIAFCKTDKFVNNGSCPGAATNGEGSTDGEICELRSSATGESLGIAPSWFSPNPEEALFPKWDQRVVPMPMSRPQSSYSRTESLAPRSSKNHLTDVLRKRDSTLSRRGNYKIPHIPHIPHIPQRIMKPPKSNMLIHDPNKRLSATVFGQSRYLKDTSDAKINSSWRRWPADNNNRPPHVNSGALQNGGGLNSSSRDPHTYRDYLGSSKSQLQKPVLRSHRLASMKSSDQSRQRRTLDFTDNNSASLRTLLLDLEANKVQGFENYEAILREQKRRDEAIKKYITPPKDPIRNLSPKTKEEVQSFLDSANQLREIRTIGGCPINPRNLRSLIGISWLNDEVINAYLHLIKSREDSREGKLRLIVLNTMFFSNLQTKGYKSVARWSKRAGAGGEKLLDLDGILIPIHKQMHWTLAYVNVKMRRLEYYDSLSGSWNAFSLLREYLEGELRDKYVKEEWSDFLESQDICPVQKNGYDCGVFLCKTAEVISRCGVLSYSQDDVPNIRKLMQAELYKGSIDWVEG